MAALLAAEGEYLAGRRAALARAAEAAAALDPDADLVHTPCIAVVPGGAVCVVLLLHGHNRRTLNKTIIIIVFFSTLTLMSLTWSNSGTGVGLLKSQTT